MGKTIFSLWLTWRGAGILIRRSFLVVSASMMGLWITGTRAMYEYALTAIAPMRSGASSSDNTYGSGLVGIESQEKCQEISSEYSCLCGGTDKQQPGLGYEGREVSHCADAKEDERRVPSLLDSLVERVQHRTVLVDTYVQSREHGDVPYDHSETDGDEEQGLPPFLDGYRNEQDADQDHGDVLPCRVGEPGEIPELLEIFDDGVHPRLS